jgi:hypothetical protein
LKSESDSINDKRRNEWLAASDEDLFQQCRCDFFKATGKGGQKRNKTSSAVRLTHSASDLVVSDSSSRSQHENRTKALRKLRFQIALKIRNETADVSSLQTDISIRNPQYPQLVAGLLDVLFQHEWSVKDAAEVLQITTSRLVKILYRDPELWQEVNRQRENSALPNLKSPR